MTGDWEIFTVTYRPAVPFFAGEQNGPVPDDKKYGAETHMMVGTKGGRKDAEATCKQYHKGCKVVAIQSRLEELANVRVDLKEKPAAKTKGKKKK